MRHSLKTALEGYYLTQIVDAFAREGVLEALGRGDTIDTIATDRGYDLRLLRGLCEFVAERSDLLDRSVLDAGVRDTAAVLDLYVGGFGRCLSALSSTLRAPGSGGQWVDEQRHAAAFARTESAHPPIFTALIRELSIGTLLELGCAGGGLLLELAGDDGFRGIGIDSNPRAIEVARSRARDRGLSERLTFVEGDLIAAAEQLAPELRDSVEALFASSIFNGFFGWSERSIESVLIQLAALFPGRILLLADYYGRLGWNVGAPSSGLGWIHDLAQLVSGQGVPPPDLSMWRAIYERSGSRFVQSLERSVDGVSTFIHIVQLGGCAYDKDREAC